VLFVVEMWTRIRCVQYHNDASTGGLDGLYFTFHFHLLSLFSFLVSLFWLLLLVTSLFV